MASVDLPDFFTIKCLLALCDYSIICSKRAELNLKYISEQTAWSTLWKPYPDTAVSKEVKKEKLVFFTLEKKYLLEK